MAILFLKPVFKQRIWGGTYFKDVLHYDLDSEKYGELWSLSAHKEGETTILNGQYHGKTLSELYKSNPELFNTKDKEFPLMVKLLYCENDLSIQVHPDNEYAARVEGQLGKTECWYFLDAKKDSSIILGHHAKTKEEMREAILNGTCEKLLDYKVVHQGDFALIKSKTIHALRSGLILLEIQQSSDVTYRLYDYNRVDKNGKKRELHVDKALDVIDFPQKEWPQVIDTNKLESKNNLKVLTDCEFFSVIKWDINNGEKYRFDNQKFHIFTCADGSLSVYSDGKEHKLSLGESFITTAEEKELNVCGNGSLLISYSK